MRTFARLILLCASLPLLVCAARAQSPPRPQQSQQPDRVARCKKAAYKFISVVSDKKHRTVEHQSWVEYNEGRKYLSVCGDLEDNFTRSVREAVAAHEAARRCESETWPLYSERVTVNYTDAPAPRREAYEAAKEYLRLCGRYGTQGTRYATRQVKRYEAALSPPKANPTVGPCDAETRDELYEHFVRNYKGSPTQQYEAFVTAKEYLCRCADADEKMTLFVKNWLLKTHGHQDIYDVSAANAGDGDAKPRCRCDEMRDEFLKSSNGGGSQTPDRQRDVYEASKKYLSVCGGKDERFDAFIRNWLEKYDRAVREFEEKRKAAEAPAQGPTKEQLR